MRLIAGAWLVRDGEILVLQRSSGASVGMWMPPGGSVNDRENPLDAAVREAREETGLTLSDPERLCDWVWETETAPWHVHHFIGEVADDRVAMSHEHLGFLWIDPRTYAREHLVAGPELPAARFGVWFPLMRQSVDLVCDWIAARA